MNMKMNNFKIITFMIVLVFTMNFIHSEVLDDCKTDHKAHDYCSLVEAGSNTGNQNISRLFLNIPITKEIISVTILPEIFQNILYPSNPPLNQSITIKSKIELII